MPSKKSAGSVVISDENKLTACLGDAVRQCARINSQTLFQGASVLEVEHNGQIYRLQKTALNKLILTK